MGEDNSVAGAYYVNFPGYRNKLMNGLGSGPLGKWVNSKIYQLGLQNSTIPLGHAGVAIVDDQGHTQYYEYGRYHGTNYGVQKGNGNYRRKPIPDAKIVDGEIDQQTLANGMAKSLGRPVEITYIDDTDPAKVLEELQSTAYDKNRPGYHLIAGPNCGSEACRVIESGREQSVGNIVKRLPYALLQQRFPLLKIVDAFPGGKQLRYKLQGYETTHSQKNGGTINYLDLFR